MPEGKPTAQANVDHMPPAIKATEIFWPCNGVLHYVRARCDQLNRSLTNVLERG